MGWPAVARICGAKPQAASSLVTNWAQRCMSGLCSGLVLTLGMRRKDLRPSSDCWRLASICWRTVVSMATRFRPRQRDVKGRQFPKECGSLLGLRIGNQRVDEGLIAGVGEGDVFAGGGG